MKDVPALVRRGGIPAIAAGWLALGWWPLPQLLPRFVAQPLDLRTGVIVVLGAVALTWFVATHKGDSR